MAFDRGIRNAEIVQRWGIIRMHQRGSMGAHSHRVAIYADQIGAIVGALPEKRAEIMRYALWHDMVEIVVGDAPGPSKEHETIEDKERRLEIERQHLWRLFPGGEWECADPVVAGIVKIADLLDEVLSIIVDKRMGNTLVDEIYEGSSAALLKAISMLRLPDKHCDEIRKHVVNAIGHHLYSPLHFVSRGRP